MENLENKTKEQLFEDFNKLSESEEKYRLMFENMMNGIAYHKIVTDKDGKPVDYIFLEINSAFEQLTGLNAKDIIGKKVTEVLPEILKDPADWIRRYGDVAINENNIQFESYAEPLDKWYSINAYCPQKNYFITIFEDITKRKENEKTIQENEKLLNTIAENFPNTFVSIIEKDLTVGFSSGLEFKKLKLNPDDFIGLTIEQVFGEHSDIVKHNYLRTFKGEETTFELIINDQYQLYKTIPIYSTDGSINRILAFVENITEQKNTLENIKENQRLLDKVGEIAKIGGWEMDLTKDGVAQWTKGTYDIVEVDQDEAVPGLNEHLNYYFPEYREMIKKKMNDLAKNRKPMKFIAKAKTKKGKIIWVEALAEAVVENNKVIKLRGTLQDITKQKEIEDSFIESKTFNETLLNTSPDIIYVYDIVESKNIYSNEGISKILGYTVNEVQEMGSEVIPLLMHKDDFKIYIDEIIPKYQNAKDGDLIEHEYRMQHKNGNWHWLYSKELIFQRLPDGSPKQIFGITSDTTERKQTEIQIKEKSEFIDKIIDSSALSTWISDKKGTAIRANQACLEFFGATEEEVIGKYNIFKDEVIKEQGFIPDIRKVFEKGEVANIIIDYNFGEVDHISVKNATHKIANSIFTPIIDINGKVSNVIIQTIDLSEIKKAEKIAIEEKNKAQQYLDIAEVILVSIDSDGIVQLINTKGREVLGYSEEEIIGKNWFDNFLPERMRKQVKEVAKKILSGEMESVKFYENEILTKSGEERLIAWNNAVLTDDKGNMIGTLSSGEDITERKKAELLISESQYYLSKAQEIGMLGSWSLDIVNNVLKWSDENYRIFGIKPGTALNYELFLNSIHPEDREYINTQWTTRMMTNDYDIEHRLIVEGKVKWVREKAEIIFNNDGEAVNAIGFTQDITERKLSEELLQEEKKKAQNYLDIAGVLLVALNDKGEIILINKKGCEILGYSDSEIINRNWFDLCIPVDIREEIREVFNQLMADKIEPVEYYENQIIDKNGELRWVAFHNTVIRNNESQIIGILFSGEDITERKNAEEELKEYQEHLEEMILERTKELEHKNKELDNALKVFVGRELKIRDLENRLRALGGK